MVRNYIADRRHTERYKKMMDVQKVNSKNKKIAMLVYGHPGVGKTRLAGSRDNTLILRPPTDHTDSIRDNDVDEIVLRDWAKMDDVYRELRAEKGAGYDWIWLDSVSLWQDTGLDDIWQDVIDKKPDRKRYGLDKGEYGINMERLSRWTRHMVMLCKDYGYFNFGITAHAAELTTPDGSYVYMPYIQGNNMSAKFCGYMNLVAYYEVKKHKGEDIRVLRTSATEEYYAKDQYDAFPESRLVNPTIDKITDAINGNNKQTKPIRRVKKNAGN